MCFSVDNFFFTVDTLFNGQKTRLNLSGSNRNQFSKTLEKLKRVIEPEVLICPGHGDYFSIMKNKI